MTSERLQTIETIFHSARELEPSLRSSFLDQACSTDAELRSEIESLLNAHESADGFIAKSAPEIAAGVLANEQAALLVGRMFGHYRLLEPLGQGGMGEVYLATDTRLDRSVALKVLPVAVAQDPGRMNRFEIEAKAASALNHPSVTQIYEIGEDRGIHFLVMEFIEGEPLDQRIGERPLPVQEIAGIGSQIADALDAAHAKGIVHRDIKPANIMLTPRGHVKVLDFGLAKMAEPRPALGSLAETRFLSTAGALLGTVEYMSPEQALGRPVDARTDIFSLGVVLYQMATGRIPFEGSSPSETIARILEAQPDAMARFNYDLPEELDRIVRKCLEKDRERRYPSARDLMVDLQGLLRAREPATATRSAGVENSHRHRG